MPYLVKDKVTEPLYAVVPYFNPWRWKSREKHTQRALKHFHDSGAVIILVEIGFNRREHVFADSGLDGSLPLTARSPANIVTATSGCIRRMSCG